MNEMSGQSRRAMTKGRGKLDRVGVIIRVDIHCERPWRRGDKGTPIVFGVV